MPERPGMPVTAALVDAWRRARHLSTEALALLADHLELLSLEAGAALRTCLWALAGVLTAVLLLLTAWGCLVAAMVLALLGAGWSPVWTILGVAAAHGLCGVGIGVLVIRQTHRQFFADTLRLLRSPVPRADDRGVDA